MFDIKNQNVFPGRKTCSKDCTRSRQFTYSVRRGGGEGGRDTWNLFYDSLYNKPSCGSRGGGQGGHGPPLSLLKLVIKKMAAAPYISCFLAPPSDHPGSDTGTKGYYGPLFHSRIITKETRWQFESQLSTTHSRRSYV